MQPCCSMVVLRKETGRVHKKETWRVTMPSSARSRQECVLLVHDTPQKGEAKYKPCETVSIETTTYSSNSDIFAPCKQPRRLDRAGKAAMNYAVLRKGHQLVRVLLMAVLLH